MSLGTPGCMTDTNPDENLDAEGIPDLEEFPPGRGIELNEEALMAPRDYPVASGMDPAYPTTAAEQRQLETVADRAAREVPDVGAEELGVGGGVVGVDAEKGVDAESFVVGAVSSGAQLDVLASAVPVDYLPDKEEEQVAQRSGAALSDRADLQGDLMGAEISDGQLVADQGDLATSPEDSAMHLASDDGY